MAAYQRSNVDQEAKDAFAEGAETIKQAVHSMKTADPPSQLLSIALLAHTAVSLVVSSLTYFNPMRIMPGFIKEVSWTNTVPGAPGAVLHLFALKGFAISLIAGLAAFAYDNKHKAMLNSALLIHHLTIVAEFMLKNSDFRGFISPPHYMHLPLALLHAVAIASWYRPDLMSGGGARGQAPTTGRKNQ